MEIDLGALPPRDAHDRPDGSRKDTVRNIEETKNFVVIGRLSGGTRYCTVQSVFEIPGK